MIKTKEQLLDFIADNLTIDTIDKSTMAVQQENASFKEDLRADELDMVELVMALEEEFGIEIPDEDAEKFITVSDVISFLQTKNINLK